MEGNFRLRNSLDFNNLQNNWSPTKKAIKNFNNKIKIYYLNKENQILHIRMKSKALKRGLHMKSLYYLIYILAYYLKMLIY